MNTAFSLICMFATLFLQQPPTSSKAEPLGELQLRINSGDTSVALMVLTRFEASGEITSETELIHLSDNADWTDLVRGGAAGLQLDVIAPAVVSLDAAFVNETGTLALMSRKQTLGLHNRYSFRLGQTLPIPETASFELSGEEIALLRRFDTAIDDETLDQLAADEETTSRLDKTCLALFNTALLQNLGKRTEKLKIDNWFAWSTGDEPRSIVGELAFQHGTLEVELTVQNGKLLHLNWQSSQLAPNWFRPVDTGEAYRQQAERLAELLLTDQPAMAKRQFAPGLQEAVAIQALAKLSTSIQDAYGNEDFETRFLDSRPSERSGTPVLLVRLMHTFSNGKKAISESTFLFRDSAKQVPRGELSNIYFSQAWTTAAPGKLQITKDLLQTILDPSREAMLAVEQIAEDYRDAINIDETRERLNRFSSWLHRNRGEALLDALNTCDFDGWSFRSSDDYSLIMGSLQPGSPDEIFVQLNFDGDSLSAFSLQTRGNFFDSSTSLNRPQPLVEAANTFWRHLMSNDRSQAYEFLSPELKEKFPRVELDLVAMSSGLREPTSISSVATRLSTRMDRSSAQTASVFSIAKFADGSQQPLRCDFQVDSSSPAIIEFTSDFSDSFRVKTTNKTDDSKDLAARLKPLLSGTTLDVTEQTQDSRRKFIDADILELFLNKTRSVLDPEDIAKLQQRIDTTGSMTHTYVLGGRREIGQVWLRDRDGEETRVQVTTEYGELTSFHIDSTKLSGFIADARLRQLAASRSNRFIGAWLSGEQIDKLALQSLTVASLQSDETMIGFEALRRKLLALTGSFDDVQCSTPALRGDGREIEVDCEISGEETTAQLKLILVLDAISLRVASLELVR